MLAEVATFVEDICYGEVCFGLQIKAGEVHVLEGFVLVVEEELLYRFGGLAGAEASEILTRDGWRITRHSRASQTLQPVALIDLSMSLFSLHHQLTDRRRLLLLELLRLLHGRAHLLLLSPQFGHCSPTYYLLPLILLIVALREHGHWPLAVVSREWTALV